LTWRTGRPKPWAIEIKQGTVPKASRGFHESLKELAPEKAFILYGGYLDKTTKMVVFLRNGLDYAKKYSREPPLDL